MPAPTDPLVEYVVALCGRAPWDMNHRQAARTVGVSESTLCRWLATDPAQHRNPSARHVAAIRAVVARLEAESR